MEGSILEAYLQLLALTKWKAVSMQRVAEKAGLKLKMEKVEGQPIRYRA